MNPRNSKRYSTNSTIPYPVMKRLNPVIVATSGGITLTLPDPVGGIAGKKATVANASSEYISVYSYQNWLDSQSSIRIPPYKSAQIQVVKTGTSTYQWSAQGEYEVVTWQTWDPTPTWTTADPTVTTEVCQFLIRNGAVHFAIELTISDGNGATDVTIAGPMYPNDLDAVIPLAGYAQVTSTVTDAEFYYDCEDVTYSNRVIGAKGFPTLTDAAACSVVISGIVPLIDWSTWTAGEVWTNTPDSVVESAFMQPLGNSVMLYHASWKSDDSNAASALVCLPPNIPDDYNVYGAVNALEKAGAAGTTWSNPLGFIDLLHNTPTSRLIQFKSWTTATDAKAVSAHVSGFYPIQKWTTWTPSLTWGTADPASITKAGIYTVEDDICYFHCYCTSADGNGATSLTIAPPAPVLHGSAKIACASYQLQNASHSDPKGYVDCNQMAAASRVISFADFTTATDAQTVTVYVSGWYPVG